MQSFKAGPRVRKVHISGFETSTSLNDSLCEAILPLLLDLTMQQHLEAHQIRTIHQVCWVAVDYVAGSCQ